MNLFRRYVLILLLFVACISYSQTKGLIYKPAGDALGKSVLDPNGDGYVSLTTAGFSGTDYGSASELKMIPLPIIGVEPTGDLTTGGSGGATDIVSVGENSNQSCYILYKTVGGIDYLIIRFRLGGASTSSKGYSLLMDTDGTFGSQYTDPKNPGYEREVVLNTGSSNAIVINTFSGAAGGITSSINFSNENYTQRSIALTTVGGDADYFYDFFIPYSALGLSAQPVRIAAATISSAGSGITGTKSDYNGVNDKLYSNNPTAIANALISSFPAISLTLLTEGGSFANPTTLAPVVNSNITASSTSISGTSAEINGSIITVYKNGTSIGTATVASNSWTLTGISGLVAGDVITAKAQTSGKDLSAASAGVTVNVAAICFTPSPTALVRTNGSQLVTGSWSPVSGTITASTVQIRLWEQSATNTFNEIPATASVYVGTNGAWSFTVTTSQSTFNGMNIYATATYNGCMSAYSNVGMKTSGSGSTKTATPTMVTSAILASPTVARTVQVTNLDSSASYLILYINGYEVARTASTIASNASYTFSYTGFVEGDVVIARAQSATASYLLSDISTSVTVSISSSPSTAPIISGTYTAGSGKTVSGTSTESAGTIIYLYKGATLLGLTTVDAYGNWSISGLTLTTGDVLTATAKASGETTSSSSGSITVAASAPTAPTISGASYQAGASSISGTGGLGTGYTLTVYVDGSSIGTISNVPASWTLSGIASGQLYKGAVITATNTNVGSGIESVLSNAVPVVGVASFCITDTSGNPITAKQSGETLNIKITAMDGANCTGNVFTGFNGTVVLSSTTSMLLGGGTTAVFVNGVLASYSVAMGTPATSVSLSAINSDDPSTKGTATFDVSAAVWKGTTSTDFNTASNWTGSFVPLSGADISYDAAANNDCYLDQNRTVAGINFNNTTKKLNLNGKTLTINGAISGNGVSSGLLTGGVSSSLVFTGTGNAGTFYMDQASLGTSNVLNNLTLNRTSLGSVTLGNAVGLKGILTVTAGTFNTGNQITFKSDLNTTAVVAPVTGVINGAVTVERFIPARRAFRFLASPVTTTTSIRTNWQEGVNNGTTSSNSNPNPGYGTHITGSVSGENGFDATLTTNPSMFTFVNSTGLWSSSISNTDVNVLGAGVPYRIMIRGDRSINLNTNTPTPTNTTLRANGNLYTGTKVITDLSSTAGGYNFIGNPYQSPVDMNQVLQASTNLNKVFYYIWDPTLNVRGGYVSVDVGTGDKSIATSSATKYLQPWQSCFVKTDFAGSASLSFQEAHKQTSTSNVNVFRKADVASSLKLELYEANAFANSANLSDALLLQFASGQNNEVDGYDADKFTNLDENFATNNNGSLLSIERRDLPQAEEVIPLYVNQYRNTNYTIVAKAKNIGGLYPFLYDKYTQVYTEIPSDDAVAYNYSVVGTDVQSTASSRFNVVFKTQSSLSNKSQELASELKVYPNPVKEGWFVISSPNSTQGMEIVVFNLLGQRIPFTVSNVNSNNLKIEIPKSVDKGVYSVEIKQDGQKETKKILIN